MSSFGDIMPLLSQDLSSQDNVPPKEFVQRSSTSECTCHVAKSVELSQMKKVREPFQSRHSILTGDVMRLLKRRRSKAYKADIYEERSQNAKKCQHIPFIYLKPGALAEFRDAQKSNRISCIATRKRRIRSSNTCVSMEHFSPVNNAEHVVISPNIPDRVCPQAFGPTCPQRKKLLAPKAAEPPIVTDAAETSQAGNSAGAQESLLESLPLELLVRIVCKLQHDQLKPVFHVCKRLRQSVIIAKQCHFNYKTPGRKRWPFQTFKSFRSLASRSGQRSLLSGVRDGTQSLRFPRTPKAPRRVTKPQRRTSIAEMSQITAALFMNSANLGRRKQKCPPGQSLMAESFHRALFSEEELCHAIAENSL